MTLWPFRCPVSSRFLPIAPAATATTKPASALGLLVATDVRLALRPQA
jgi:hypothetical protein